MLLPYKSWGNRIKAEGKEKSSDDTLSHLDEGILVVELFHLLRKPSLEETSN